MNHPFNQTVRRLVTEISLDLLHYKSLY